MTNLIALPLCAVRERMGLAAGELPAGDAGCGLCARVAAGCDASSFGKEGE